MLQQQQQQTPQVAEPEPALEEAPCLEAPTAGNAAAQAGLPPPPPGDPLDDGVLGAAAAQLGVAVPALMAGAQARQRTAAAGTIGLMEGGRIFVDDRACGDALSEVIVHELVHVAQRRLGGAGDLASAEAEAHALASEWARSGRMGRPVVPLGEASAAWELPEGQDMAVHGASIVLARRSWLVARGLDVAAGGTAPELSEAILAALQASAHWSWTASEPADRGAVFVSEMRYRPYTDASDAQDPIIPVAVEQGMHEAFGLPAGSTFEWDVFGDRAVLTVDADALNMGGRTRLTHALLQEAFDALADRCGLPRGEAPGSQDVEVTHQVAMLQATRAGLVERFGEAWAAFPGTGRQHGGQGTEGGSGGGPAANVTFDDDVSEEDRAFARRFARRLPQGPDGGEAPALDRRMIAAWRRIDSHPLEDRILARMNRPGPNDERVPWTPEAFEDVILQTQEEHHAELRQILREGLRREGPLLDTRVDGRIVNGGQMIFAGQRVPFHFEVQHTAQGDSIRFPVPWACVDWTSQRIDGTDIDDGSTHHQDSVTHAPDAWETEFPSPGEYVVRADVEHTFFQPWAFEQHVQVESEETRRQQMEETTFDDGPFSSVVARRATTFGLAEDDRGQFTVGDLPADWVAPDSTCAETSRPEWSDLSADQRARIAGLEAMARDEEVPSSVRSMAEERAEALRESLEEQEQDRGRGAQFFSITAGYLGRLADAQSQPLQLTASARLVEDGVEVVLWDHTQAYDTRTHHFDATADTFHGALRDAAFDLAKSYPSGRMSVRAEALDGTLNATSRWLGWELECNSHWEVFRRTVWDPTAQVAVNVAATAVMVYAPATAVVIVPMLMAYNGVDTVAGLWELQESGALEASDVAIGVGQLLVDIVPVAGRAGRLGRTGMAVLEVAEFGADLLLFSLDAQRTLDEINTRLVDDLWPLHRDIAQRERDNPSDPELPALRAQFDQLRLQAQTRASEQIQEMVNTRALMMAGSHAAGQIRGGDEGEVPHIDADAEAGLLRQDFDATQAVPSAALPRISDALGLPVHPELVDGGDVHLHFARNPDGSMGRIVMSIGRDATLETALQHVHSVRAMRRYRGMVGILRNTLDHLRTWLRTGHVLSEGGREAMFELEKLEPAVDALRQHLENTPMDDATRARLEAERTSLQTQIETQRERLNSTDPGIGVVASHADPAHAGTATPHHLATGSDVTAPLFDANARFRNADLEAAYGRYDGPLNREDWMDHLGGSPELTRILEDEMGTGWRQRRRSDEVFHSASAGDAHTWDIPPGPARDRLDEIAQWREYFRHQRDALPPRSERRSRAQVDGMLARMRELTDRVEDELGLTQGGPRRDLSRTEWEEFDRLHRTLRQELHRARSQGAVTHASEQVGMIGGDLYMRARGRQRIHPVGDEALVDAGGAGTVDAVYQGGNEYWVVEDKGNGASLGSRRIDGERYEQGHARYLAATLEGYAGTPLYDTLRTAWTEGRLHYVEATTPLVAIGEGAAGVPEMGARRVRVREFDIGTLAPVSDDS